MRFAVIIFFPLLSFSFCEDIFSGLSFSSDLEGEQPWYQCQLPDFYLRLQGKKTEIEIRMVDSKSPDADFVRKRNFLILFLLNLEKDESLSPKIGKAQQDVLRQFSLHPMGSCMVARVVREDASFFQKGWFDFFLNSDSDFLADRLSGNLTEEGDFEAPGRVFLITGFDGYGATGQSGLISLGNKGFQSKFLGSAQNVDPLAIIAHEFGHTRFGDRSSGENLDGEARTVRDYENPVRVFNGFEKRKIYYSFSLDRHIHIDTMEEFAGLPTQPGEE